MKKDLLLITKKLADDSCERCIENLKILKDFQDEFSMSICENCSENLKREIQKIERNIQGNDVRYYEGEYLCREHYEEKRELETS